MTETDRTDYTALDIPHVCRRLFHPRQENASRSEDPKRDDVMIDVEPPEIRIGGSFHFAGIQAPTVLFFHGNGEIAADYDDLGTLYTRIGLNFFVVDYRGYGRSSGTPTVTAMMNDCRRIFRYAEGYLEEKKINGGMTVMGRSLGSAPALEIAAVFPDQIRSLIIESGFAHVVPLLEKIGIGVENIGFREVAGFCHIDKIRRVEKPCLVIHAELDHIIPFGEGEALYNACSSPEKQLLEIKGANHNDLFFRDMNRYLAHVKKFARDIPAALSRGQI